MNEPDKIVKGSGKREVNDIVEDGFFLVFPGWEDLPEGKREMNMRVRWCDKHGGGNAWEESEDLWEDQGMRFRKVSLNK